MATVYVTGTDTGVGKSLVSATLLYTLRTMGLRAFGMKPVASGCRRVAGAWRNEDAELLHAASSEPRADYALVNPYALPEPAAPEIAAAVAGISLDLEVIRRAHATLAASADWVVVEGVGGWMAPISERIDQADLVAALGRPPLLLVVGIRLGCINHARLSLRAALADGCEVLGWVANVIDADLNFLDRTLTILDRVLDVPRLGLIEHQTMIDPAALVGRIVAPFARPAGLSSHSDFTPSP